MSSEISKAETAWHRDGGRALARPSGVARDALDFGRAWEYAPAPEATDHVTIAPRYELFIGGKLARAEQRQVLRHHQPRAPRRSSPRSPRPTQSDVDDAVQAARARVRARLVEDARARARQVPLPHRARAFRRRRGSSPSSSRWTAASPSRSRATSICRSRRRTSSITRAGRTSSTTPSTGRAWRPLGVAGQIIPWNFPLLMAAWKIAPALACGNTVVLKPAETTPLTALLLAQHHRGGGASARASSTSSPARARRAPRSPAHPGVDKVAFTGSPRSASASSGRSRGRRRSSRWSSAARRRTSSSPTRRSIRPSRGSSTASTSTRATSAAPARGCSSRRACTTSSSASSRDRIATLRVGDPLDKNTDVGAINSKAQLDKIRELVASGEDEGAERSRAPCALPAKGYWFAPTFFTGVAQSSRIAREEIFGPVLSCSRSARPTRRSRRRTTRCTASPPASGPTRARRSSGWRSA